VAFTISFVIIAVVALLMQI